MSQTTAKPAAAETEIQQVTGGAILPDATHNLEKIMLVSLMVPMGDPRPITTASGVIPVGCHMGLPTILWGLSGTAKSAITKQASRRLGLPLEVVYPGTHAPEDFSSLPVVINNQLAAACMLTQVTNLNQMGGGVLFLDEVSCAPPATQGSMLSMVLERQVGAVKFVPGIRILAAANPPEYSAGGWGLEAPFANRFAHFYVKKPPRERLVDWLLSEGSHKVQPLDEPMAKLQAGWGEQWSRVKGLWAGFVTAHDSVRNMQPKPDNVQAGYCWPSDRTWEFAFRSIATVRALGLDSSLEALMIESCVGEGAATEYMTWAADADLPDPREVLIKGWPIDRRLDRVHAVYASVTSLVIDQQGPERYQMATLAWKRLMDLANAGYMDIATTHSSALIADGLGPKAPGVPSDLIKESEAVVLKVGRVKNLTAQYRT